MRVPALDRILGAERALLDRARLLLDMSKLLSMVSRRNSAPHHPNPAEAKWRWRGERSEPVRLSFRDHHSCSVYDGSRVQNRAGPSGSEL